MKRGFLSDRASEVQQPSRETVGVARSVLKVYLGMALDLSELANLKHQIESCYTLKDSSISQLHYVRSGLVVNTIPGGGTKRGQELC